MDDATKSYHDRVQAAHAAVDEAWRRWDRALTAERVDRVYRGGRLAAEVEAEVKAACEAVSQAKDALALAVAQPREVDVPRVKERPRQAADDVAWILRAMSSEREEDFPVPRTLGDLFPGDVFFWHGIPHVRVEGPAPRHLDEWHGPGNTAGAVNLISGLDETHAADRPVTPWRRVGSCFVFRVSGPSSVHAGRRL